MTFKDLRRQKFLGEVHAREFEDQLAYRMQLAREDLAKPDLMDRVRSSCMWCIASTSLELLILRYTAGQPVAELAKQLPAVIAAFETYVPLNNPPPQEAHTLTITQHEAYVYVLWLLALCQLLGHAELVPTVIGWLDQQAVYNRGRDGLFEAIAEKLTGQQVPVERVLLHPSAYRALAKASAPDAQDRPTLVKEFLEGWYKNMKPCYWHGTHTDKEGSSYFGYWAFEAALVTYLWDIDDSSFRDHLVYPKDLVDFARQNFPYNGPLPESGQGLRCEAGRACPRAGFWFTPARTDSRQHFEQGQEMPAVGGDYGATIWQWDANQSQ